MTTVSAGTMTSSPGPTPKAASDWCSVEVPEFEVMAKRTPNLRAKASSKRVFMVPVVELPKPESRTSLT